MLSLQHISVSFPGFQLRDISFDVAGGEYFILLGESGAGKSLLLETIAGLNKQQSGTITLSGKDITHEKIQQRCIGLVFQDHAVFPHLSVKENIVYPLKHKHFSAEEKASRIQPVIETLQIGHLIHRRPPTLSGGELQRVALARALVQQPQVLLLDEPLASIDSKLKSDLRALLRQINRMGQTIIHVTHDFDEAVSLADRIAIIDKGSIVQTGTPHEVFSNPVNGFVAHFAGIRNFFKVRIEKQPGHITVFPHEKVPVVLNQETDAEEGFLLIRNEDILISEENFESSALNNFKGIVEDVYPLRYGMEVVVNIGIPLHVQVSRESAEKLRLVAGKPVWTHFKASSARLICG
ncbi:MAG TPA: ABC transporter ATP-binding protein [Bacteroidales bacterium]|nr:ABC transporter ATP-binding protein [Bacteroidales bacterium]HPT03366.1 ABC transporter ATP-binding protein [Bacteroidales bacterium]